MKALIIYDSKYGNTQRIAEAIAGGLPEGIDTTVAAAVDLTAIPDGIGLLLIGGPTHGHGISLPLKSLLDQFDDAVVAGVPFAAFDTRYHMPKVLTGSAAGRIAKQLEKQGGRLLVPPESFFIEHAEGPLEDGELERASAWAGQIAASMLVLV